MIKPFVKILFILLLPFIFVNKSLSNINNAFPGRRVGGGTRGECSSRLLINLVNKDNALYLNKLDPIAILAGKTKTSEAIRISLINDNRKVLSSINIPSETSELIIIKSLPIGIDQILEAKPICKNDTDNSDPFTIVSSVFPPTKSHLLKNKRNKDKEIKSYLSTMLNKCNTQVEVNQIINMWGLEKGLAEKYNLPENIPIKCFEFNNFLTKKI